MTPRPFPPPWSAELTPNWFIVRDGDGQQIVYVYYESEPGRRSAAKLLTKDEARRIAADIAKLPHIGEPGLLQRRDRVVGPLLFIEVLSDLYFVLPLMAASSLRGSHEKGYCPIDSCAIGRAGMLGRHG
jgi:hypothetical protein